MIYQRMVYPSAREVASQATNSIRCPRADGPSIYWITQDCTLPTIATLNTYGVISQKSGTNRIEYYKESIDWQSVIAVHSRCQGVVGCLAHVRAYAVKQ